MYDIDFYMQSFDLLKKVERGEVKDVKVIMNSLEGFRSQKPVVYNIETTNACNMCCVMCPRTTMMTRPVETMSADLFKRIIEQLNFFSEGQWTAWERFVAEQYGVVTGDMNENHFFLLIIPKVIQLLGYGDPLLDENMPEHVKLLAQSGLFSYFSCNPANIDIDKTVLMFENGLDYIKYSIESVKDSKHKEIRGTASDFSKSYQKICRLLDLKRRNGYKTVIIITMLNLDRKEQADDFKKLRAAFSDKDVYIYLKSEDQQWYRRNFHNSKSVHWSEICKHPWMSMTVKSNGEVVMCMEDFNNEIILGDIRRESLHDIWSGTAYRQFRRDHFECTPGLKCTEQCDMHVIGELIKRETTST